MGNSERPCSSPTSLFCHSTPPPRIGKLPSFWEPLLGNHYWVLNSHKLWTLEERRLKGLQRKVRKRSTVKEDSTSSASKFLNRGADITVDSCHSTKNSILLHKHLKVCFMYAATQKIRNTSTYCYHKVIQVSPVAKSWFHSGTPSSKLANLLIPPWPSLPLVTHINENLLFICWLSDCPKYR